MKWELFWHEIVKSSNIFNVFHRTCNSSVEGRKTK